MIRITRNPTVVIRDTTADSSVAMRSGKEAFLSRNQETGRIDSVVINLIMNMFSYIYLLAIINQKNILSTKILYMLSLLSLY